MNIIVLFDSLFGNTEKIAESIVKTLANFHNTKVIKVEQLQSNDLEGINLLIIGSPTHGGWFTEPIKKFIVSLPTDLLQSIRVATFDTSVPSSNMGFVMNHLAKLFGNAAPRIAKRLIKKGATVIDSKIFYVLGKEGPLREGEIERAQEWANQLQNMM